MAQTGDVTTSDIVLRGQAALATRDVLSGTVLDAPPPADVMEAIGHDVLGMVTGMRGWDDAHPGDRLNAIREVLLGLADIGAMYVAVLSDPAIENLTNDAGELLPVPDGYTRVGACSHRPDAMGRFMGWPDVSATAPAGGMYPMGRVLVLTTLSDVGGPIHIGTYIPRVRSNWVDDGQVEVFAYYDNDARFTCKVMYGGAGWNRLYAATGLEAAAE